MGQTGSSPWTCHTMNSRNSNVQILCESSDYTVVYIHIHIHCKNTNFHGKYPSNKILYILEFEISQSKEGFPQTQTFWELHTLWCWRDIKTITELAYRECHKCNKNYLPNSELSFTSRFQTSAQLFLHCAHIVRSEW